MPFPSGVLSAQPDRGGPLPPFPLPFRCASPPAFFFGCPVPRPLPRLLPLPGVVCASSVGRGKVVGSRSAIVASKSQGSCEVSLFHHTVVPGCLQTLSEVNANVVLEPSVCLFPKLQFVNQKLRPGRSTHCVPLCVAPQKVPAEISKQIREVIGKDLWYQSLDE